MASCLADNTEPHLPGWPGISKHNEVWAEETYTQAGIVKPESEVPKSKVPKSRPKGLGLTQ